MPSNYDGQGKSKQQETYDSMMALSIAMLSAAAVLIILIGLLLWWLI